jgi:hypothetical protein
MSFDISAPSSPPVPSHGSLNGPVDRVVWDAHEAIVFLFRKLGGTLPSGHEAQFRKLGAFVAYFSAIPDVSIGSDIHHTAWLEAGRIGSSPTPSELSRILLSAFGVDRERGDG